MTVPMEDQAVPPVEYRHAAQGDLIAAAEVFLSAFPQSVQHYVGHEIGPAVVADVLAIALDCEPGGFFVAVLNGRVSGYIFAPADFPGLARTAVRHWHLARMFARWSSGRYGIGLRPVRLAVWNWLHLWRESRDPTLRSDARILSVAVAPDAQGRGIGSELLRLGLEYLESRGAALVRLEVRPDNLAAIHVYEKHGFKVKGRTNDTQGEWLIMVRVHQSGSRA